MKGECKDTEAVMRVKHRQAILASMIKRKELLLFEYFPEREVFILYDGQFQMLQKIVWNICKKKIKFIRKISGKW